MNEKLYNLIWILPAMVILGIFTVYPLGFLLFMSFTDSTLTKASFSFVGFANFQKFFADPVATGAIGTSLIFAFGGAALTMTIAFVVGVFLNLDFRFNSVVRALILIPWMFSLVDVSLEWKWMLDPAVGIYNWLLIWLGIIQNGIPWIGLPGLALFVVMVVMAWYFSPFMALLIVASLHGVPGELYEASALDGAGKLARFRHITLNWLKYPLVIGGLLTAGWFANSIDVVYVMTAGGPANSTMILPFYMFENVFDYLHLAYGSAIGLINFAILGVVSGIFLFVFRRYWRGE